TEAERMNAPLPLRFGLARTHLAWGRTLLERRSSGDVERGNELLERALACSREEGYGGVEREAAALLASPAAQPDPPPLPSRLAASTSTFVGRAHELEVLAAHARAAASGQRRLVLIGGEPGIGKTALAAQAARAAWTERSQV